MKLQAARRWMAGVVAISAMVSLGFGVVAAPGVGASGISAGDEPFPDAWFFDGPNRPAPLKSLEGKPAKEIEIETWIGDPVSLSKLRGKVVIVDFWATWCGPCMAAVPENVELVEKYKEKGLAFVGVHDASSGWDSAPQVVKDKKINYPVGKDKSGAKTGVSTEAYQLQFWPTYVAIDRKGIVRAAGLMPQHVEDVVKVLLAEEGPSEAEVAKGFGPEVFAGGAKRPESLRAMEGKPAPALTGETWLGTRAGEALPKGEVGVVYFANPGLPMTLEHLKQIAALEAEFGARGVHFVGVCAEGDAWKGLEPAVKAAKVAMSFVQDAARKDAKEGEATGVNASAWGVKFAPALVVVDRAGNVRAAGVKAEKLKGVVESLLGE
ncbi:MAG: redoxin family protein [Phycisphaerales bacterium]